MPPESKSIGAAIDELIAALAPLDAAARMTAIRAACDHLAIKVEGASALVAGLNSGGGGSLTVDHPTDIRIFKQQKNPSSANEMACVVAYYLQQLAPTEEKKAAISAAEVDKYFQQAGFPLVKRSDQLLVNARAAGYFDSAGRGSYRLNAVGNNLVAHSLPRVSGDGVARMRAPRGASRVRPTKRKSASKKR